MLPPTLDYTLLKNVDAHSGFSVSPQGRVMCANYSIRENLAHGHSPASRGALLLFDPQDHLPFAWPVTNFSEMKSAMIGRVSRAVAVGVFDATLRTGFSLFTVPSVNRGVSVQPYDRAELQVRLIPYDGRAGDGTAPAQYFAVEACTLCEARATKGGTNCSGVPVVAQCGPDPKLVREIDPASFYRTLIEHTAQWQGFHGDRAFRMQIYGPTEGARVVDTARSVISAGLSNFIGLRCGTFLQTHGILCTLTFAY